MFQRFGFSLVNCLALPVVTATLAGAFMAGCDRAPFSPSGYQLPITPVGAMRGTPQSIGGYNVYFGHLHNHCSVSDGSGSPDQAYNYAKNTANLDFFGLADHSGSISSTEWTSIKNAANAHTQDGVFVGFWGFEWSSNGNYGHVTVINTDDYCATSAPTNSWSGLMTWLSTRNGAAFCNHPGREDDLDREFEHFTTTPSAKVVGMELWNKSDPFSVYYYNDGYFANDNNRSYFDEALSRGWKLGASGSEDNHNPTWGTSNDYRMAILATSLTRAELFSAILARRFYSTLDKNLALSFKMSGQEMGSTISPGTHTAQILAVDDNGETFTKVMMFDKNRDVVKTWTISTTSVNVSISVNALDGDYYYVKVTQADGNEAISSPIWVSGGTPGNQPPVANAGPDQTVIDSDGDGSQVVMLDGSASSDPDGSISSYVWKESGTQIATGMKPMVVLSTGTHAITLTVTDNGSLTASDEVVITVAAPGTTPTTISRRVVSGNDDAEERNSGGIMYLNSSDLELVYDNSTTGNQHVGMRFTNITVPRGKTITNAYIQFTVDEKSSGTSTLTIQGQAADNAAGFTSSSYNISSRPKTSAGVSWSPDAWTTVGQAGTAQRTPDIKSIVQEIVNRSGWVSGNALVILVNGTGKRTAESYEGSSSSAPLLVITYQ